MIKKCNGYFKKETKMKSITVYKNHILHTVPHMNNIKATQIVTLLHKLLCVWSAINAHNLTPVKHDNQNMAQVSVQHPLSNKIVSITGMT